MTAERTAFLTRSNESLGRMYDALQQLPEISLEDLPPDTALVIVDMVNGFAKEGPLSSPRVDALIPEIARLQQAFLATGRPVIAFADTHPADAVEFSAYPAHCIEGTSEADVVNALKRIGGYTLIPKRSTNGFLEPAFQRFLEDNPTVVNFVIVGDCTDICVLQFATSLKAEFNRRNVRARIIVPVAAVDTFDAPLHDGDLMHLVACYSMLTGGIEVVTGLK